MQLELIKHIEDGTTIYQRATDGYVNATAMCKAAGKLGADYYRLVSTKEFITELSSTMGIPIDLLVRKIMTGENEIRGTWIHPQVAIHLGQWLSPKFAVKVSKWVLDWSTGKTKSNLPYHLRRYLMNSETIPYGHFSILQEMTIILLGPLEAKGYILPSHLVPDISEGRIFSQYLKYQGINTDKMPTYLHRYEDGRVVPAKIYPNEYLFAFREHVAKEWLPNRAIKYFEKRDVTALPHLNQMLQLGAKYATKSIAI